MIDILTHLKGLHPDWDEAKLIRISNYLSEEIEKFIDIDETSVLYKLSLKHDTNLIKTKQVNYHDLIDNKTVLTLLTSGDHNMDGIVARIPENCITEASQYFIGLPLYFSEQRTEMDVIGYVSDVSVENGKIVAEITFAESMDLDLKKMLNECLIDNISVGFNSTNVCYNDIQWVSDICPTEISLVNSSLIPIHNFSIKTKNNKITVGLSEIEKIYIEYCLKAASKKDTKSLEEFKNHNTL